MDRTNLYTLIHDLSDEFDYIALGDNDHSDPFIKDLRSDLALFQVVHDAGYNAFVLEKPPEDIEYDQNIIQSLKENPDIKPEYYFEALVNNGYDPTHIIGAFAQNAYDMTAIYPDPRYTPEIKIELNRAYETLKNMPDQKCSTLFLVAHFKANPDAEKLIDDSIDTGNEVIAERIEKQSGGRAFIIYGDGHFSESQDLNEFLGADHVVHIAAIASRNIGYGPEDGLNEGETVDYPDYIYVVNEDAVIPFDLNDPAVVQIMNNYTSDEIGSLDQGTFDTCVDALPDNLKEQAPTQQDYEQSRAGLSMAPK